MSFSHTKLAIASLLMAAGTVCQAEDILFTFSQSVTDPDSGRSMVITGVCRPAAVRSTTTALEGSTLSDATRSIPLECGLSPKSLNLDRDARNASSVWNVGGSLVTVAPPPLAIYQAINTKPVYVMECNEDGSYCETTERCWEDPVELQSICEPL